MGISHHADDRTVGIGSTRRAHRLRSGDGIAHGGRYAALIGEIDIFQTAGRAGDDVLALRDGPAQPGPVHLDDQVLPVLDVKGEAAAITEGPEPAGVHAGRDVLDGELDEFMEAALAHRIEGGAGGEVADIE